MRAMSTPRRRAPLFAGAVAVVAAACSSGSGVSTGSANPVGRAAGTVTSVAPPPDDGPATPIPGPAGDAIEWERVRDELERGTLDVPVDYDDPSRGNFRLFLVRRPADDQDDKIGTLLVNPGGPGASGAQFAAQAEALFDDELLDRFDIVGWDPRGTYDTEPAIDCIDDYDALAGLDITPDTPAERQAAVDQSRDFQEACAARNAAIIQHVGTNDSARDMDSIRRALGEDEISYFGFSYGSELGATWATTFPDTVRAAVLDGAKDPNASGVAWERKQSAGFEQALDSYLAACSRDRDCAFHNGGNAADAFDELMAELEAEPLPTLDGRPDLTRGMALQAVALAMYDSASWPVLSEALSSAEGGDGGGLLFLYDTYFERKSDGTWSNLLEAFEVISCMDSPLRTTIEQDDADTASIATVAPRFAPATVGSYDCVWLPVPEDPRVPITAAGAGPIVVIGTTGDPATPLDSTIAMADALEDGRLVVVDADRHTGYGVNDCVDDIVHEYLLDLEVPPARTDC